MEWLNQNAGAVQAMSAVVTVFLTIVLVGVTCWYAALTRRMAFTMERQLAASFQPDIDLQITNRFTGSSVQLGVERENVSGTIVVLNKGEAPVKIVAVAMKLVFDHNIFPPQSTKVDAQQRVLAPGKRTVFPHRSLNVPQGGTQANYEQFAQIHCSDLAGISRYTFSTSDRSEGVINQSLVSNLLIPCKSVVQ